MYADELVKFGLLPAEAKIYSALLSFGDNTASAIAKKTGLGRTNIYEYAKSLIKKGLAGEYEKNGKIFYKAEDPGRLQGLVDSQIRGANSLSLTLSQILPRLDELYKTNSDMPIVKHILGIKGYKEIFDRLFFSTSETHCYLLIPDLDFYEPPEPQYHNMIYKNQIYTYLLVNRGSSLTEFNKRDAKENRSTLLIPAGKMKIYFDTLIFDDYFVFGNLAKKNFKATVIKNDSFCKQMTSVLQFVCNLSQENQGS